MDTQPQGIVGEGEGLRVLIVAATDLHDEIGGTVIHAPGVSRTVVQGALEAQGAARALKPRLVLVDAATVRPARDVVKGLRQDPLTRNTSIAVLAGSRGLGEAERLRAAGANAVLPRPVDLTLWDARLRRFLTVPARQPFRAPVRLRPWSGGASAPQSLEALALDISMHGLLVELARLLEVGTKVDVELTLPGDPRPSRVVGEVIRSEGTARAARVGLEFLVLPAEVRRALRAFTRRADDATEAVADGADDESDWEGELRASEARRTALLEASRDAVIVADPEGRMVELNRQAETTFGKARGEMLGRTLWDALSPPALRRRHRVRLRHLLATPVSRDGWSLEDVALRASGESFPVEIHAIPTWVKGRRYFTSVVRDVGARKAAQEAGALEHALREILGQGLSERDTLQAVLLEVCAEGWDVAHYWTLDAEAGVLRCSLTSHGGSGHFMHLHSASREEALPRGTDLPGRAWLAGAPIWVDDVRRDASFMRQAAAARGGLRSAVAFPARTGPRTLGVVECLSRERRTPPLDMEARLSSLGSQIAQYVESARAALALRRRAGMLEAVTVGAELLLRGASWKACVAALLSGIGDAAGASRAFFCESDDHPEPGDSRCAHRHEWLAAGVLPRPVLAADYPLGVRGLPGWTDRLRGGDVVTSRVGRADAREREVLGAQAVRATLLVPVHEGHVWRGVLGMEDAWLDREWNDAERGALLSAARVLGTAITRRAPPA